MSAFSVLDISNTFHRFTQLVHLLPMKPNDDDLLCLYGYYKQSTLGDCMISRPTGLFDFKEKKKWDAWNGNKGMKKEESMNSEWQTLSKVLTSLSEELALRNRSKNSLQDTPGRPS